MKKDKLWVLLFLLLLAGQPAAWAYWSVGLEPEETTSHVLDLGRWYQQPEPYDADNPDHQVYTPGESYQLGKPYQKGSIVIGPDGKLYEFLVDTPAGKEIDFDNPNHNMWQPMEWREDTDQYRWFHHYQTGDYVWHNGALYRAVIVHNPNTATQKAPDEPGNAVWRKVAVDQVPDNVWVRSKVYMRGEIVTYRRSGLTGPFQTYISQVNYNVGNQPNQSPNWQLDTGETRSLAETERLDQEVLEDLKHRLAALAEYFEQEDVVIEDWARDSYQALLALDWEHLTQENLSFVQDALEKLEALVDEQAESSSEEKEEVDERAAEEVLTPEELRRGEELVEAVNDLLLGIDRVFKEFMDPQDLSATYQRLLDRVESLTQVDEKEEISVTKEHERLQALDQLLQDLRKFKEILDAYLAEEEKQLSLMESVADLPESVEEDADEDIQAE